MSKTSKTRKSSKITLDLIEGGLRVVFIGKKDTGRDCSEVGWYVVTDEAEVFSGPYATEKQAKAAAAAAVAE